MAYHKPADIDEFVAQNLKADMRIRALLADDLVTYLADPENSIVCTDIGLLIDFLVAWLTGSHFKIAQKSLEALTELVKRLDNDFVAYLPTILPHAVDRLGDAKDVVREKTQVFLSTLMEHRVIAPRNLLEKLSVCFKHKNAKVREEYLQTIVNTLNDHGAQSLSVKNYVAPIAELLTDSSSVVRDAAIQALVEIYKHVGDRVRIDLKKKGLPQAKMQILDQRFDLVKAQNQLLPTAYSSAMAFDEPDYATLSKTRLVKRTTSASVKKQNPSEPTGDAGAVTWETFEASFEAVPSVNVFSQRDIDELMRNINLIIGNNSMDWEKRVDALKKIRSLILHHAQSLPSFTHNLKDLSIAFLDILKELRSQVIREACITIAYMCKVMGNKTDQFCLYILQEMINLVTNSAKVISSSSITSLKYVIKYVHVTKLLPIILQNLMQSKSKELRSIMCELIGLVCEEWTTREMERCAVQIREGIKKGISDADNDARKFSRRAFWSFKAHFPEQAELLYKNLDSSTQKAVDREQDIMSGINPGSLTTSLRGSNSSLNSVSSGIIKRRQSSGLRSPAPISSECKTSSFSSENISRLHRTPSLTRSSSRTSYGNPGSSSGIPVARRDRIPPRGNLRSVSAVDSAAAQRARARAQYSNMARLKVASGTASLPRSAKKLVGGNATPGSYTSPEHRPGARPLRSTNGVSQSQPTSRSTSPSSRISVLQGRLTGTVPKRTSAIPRSLTSSRETSPTRTQVLGSYKNRVMSSGYGMSSPRRVDRPPINPNKPLMAHRILQQSREAESALADALGPNDLNSAGYSSKLLRDDSDESEVSSICSDRSTDYIRKGSDSFLWSGSRSRLESFKQPIDDIDQIIHLCSSTHWAERKDGLENLAQYLTDGKKLNSDQLKGVLDLFRKMFMDNHTRVYALFLDTVNELILTHFESLDDWLFILLTRLFNKLGTDLLVSMQDKIWKTLHLVYEYFQVENQISCVFRILIDGAQTPSTKTKIAMLRYLSNLISKRCTANDFPSHPSTERAIIKIIQLSGDQKSLELRNQARCCIMSLYNCNTAKMTMLLSNLPKSLQDNAWQYIKEGLPNSISHSPSPPCTSPKLQSAYNNAHGRDGDYLTNMNSEDVYKSLHKTTTEIQNYSFEAKMEEEQVMKKVERYDLNSEVDYSPRPLNGVNGGANGNHFSNKFSGDSYTPSDNTSTKSNTPDSAVKLESNGEGKENRVSRKHTNYTIDDNGELVTERGTKESDIIQKAILLTRDTPTETIEGLLCDLSLCVKYGNCELPTKHFKGIMKMLLTLVDSSNNDIIIAALHVLARIMRSMNMQPCWRNFLELILLKIIDCYKTSKEVTREIDVIITRVAGVLPLDPSINILNPVIATGEYPSNLCALKFIYELVGVAGEELTDQHLDCILPNIARLADATQSLVRKCAVFCIVKLYKVKGEDKLQPVFKMLSASKIRLLNVYIAKEQQPQRNE